jgi:hypothetical protein
MTTKILAFYDFIGMVAAMCPREGIPRRGGQRTPAHLTPASPHADFPMADDQMTGVITAADRSCPQRRVQ